MYIDIFGCPYVDVKMKDHGGSALEQVHALVTAQKMHDYERGRPTAQDTSHIGGFYS